jgi:hypothetical protein
LRRALTASTRSDAKSGDTPSTTAEGDGYRAFLRELNALMEKPTSLSSRVSSFEDYRWLSKAAVKWQNVFALLDVPTFVHLDPPSARLLPPVLETRAEATPTASPEAALNEQELDYWIKTHAELFAYTRIAHTMRFSTQEEQEQDRHMAFVHLASDILDGKINFVQRISPSSYWHLERVSMEDLKHLRAYLLWLERGGGFGQSQMDRNYLDVCDHLRSMLTNPGIKAPAAAFDNVRRHLLDQYLTLGRIDEERNEFTRWLIGDKAYRLYEKTGRTDSQHNWDTSSIYVKMFYENIIPAVLDGDYESTLCVLKALQCDRFAPGSLYPIINAFEATLATYFLRADLIQRVWNDSKEAVSVGQAGIISEAQAPPWPGKYEVPSICSGRFEVGVSVIRFRGVMSSPQKEALLAQLTGAHRVAIESLYTRSRAVCRDSTL